MPGSSTRGYGKGAKEPGRLLLPGGPTGLAELPGSGADGSPVGKACSPWQ